MPRERFVEPVIDKQFCFLAMGLPLVEFGATAMHPSDDRLDNEGTPIPDRRLSVPRKGGTI